MSVMTLEDWIKKYNRKTPEPFKRDERFMLYYLPDRGFCEVGQTDDMVIINQLCGDARYWKDKVSDMARKVGIKKCGTWCIRQQVKAYIRLFGYKILKTENTADGLPRYHCIHKETGKEGLMSPAFRYKDGGKQAYFVTWEP